MPRPSLVHLIILLVVIILIFGAPKLPGIARNIGKSLKVFKSEVEDLRGEKPAEDQDAERPAKPITPTSSAPTVDDVTRTAEANPTPAAETQPSEDDVRRDQ